MHYKNTFFLATKYSCDNLMTYIVYICHYYYNYIYNCSNNDPTLYICL